MAGYGFLLLGPSQHLWFNLLSKSLPKRDMLTTFKKMFMGQAVYGPVSTTVFFSYNAALQGRRFFPFFLKGKRETFYQYNVGSWDFLSNYILNISACVGTIMVLVEFSRPKCLTIIISWILFS